MKLVLYHKIFLSFIVTILVMMAFTMLIMHFSVTKNFNKFVSDVELADLDNIVEAMEKEYIRSSG